MAAIDLSACMDGIAALTVSAGIVTTAYAWPVESINPPCVVVGYPPSITFDITFGRGGDEATFPVWFVVGLTSTKDARDRLSTVLADTSSIKSALDGKQSFGDVRVTDASIDQIPVGDVTYVAAKFDVEVVT